MSRTCNSPTSTTGNPCEDTVADHEDHCAAGHPCPPAAASSRSTGHQTMGPAGAPFSVDDLTGPSPGERAADLERYRPTRSNGGHPCSCGAPGKWLVMLVSEGGGSSATVKCDSHLEELRRAQASRPR
jgi:hypothetical protein